MQESWRSFFKFDPLPFLQKIINPALQYFIQRDLLDQVSGPVDQLWMLPAVEKILKKQLESGAWPDQHPTKHKDTHTNYLLLETYRNLGVLIELYGLNNTQSKIRQAAEYILAAQTPEGDFRGIYGNQYSTNYSSGILELLVKGGFVEDERIHRAFRWLLAHQQDEGGWTLPMQTYGAKTYEWEQVMHNPEILSFEPDKPFSHVITGIVLRAFAAHPKYRNHPDARKAGELITARFFREDKYSARKDASYWTAFSFPFWWTDLISVLDALALMGFSKNDSRIGRALNYFRKEQQATGSWKFYVLKNKSLSDLPSWLSFVLCRMIKRFYANNNR
jgi:hypothetical protein